MVDWIRGELRLDSSERGATHLDLLDDRGGELGKVQVGRVELPRPPRLAQPRLPFLLVQLRGHLADPRARLLLKWHGTDGC